MAGHERIDESRLPELCLAGRRCGQSHRETLREAGIEVWLDQSELRGGDAWDAAIRKQIKACTLFMPIISANTRARAEGYFRLEWKLAVDRSHLMAAERAFLLPVVIDGTRDDDALVPTNSARCSGRRCRRATFRPISSSEYLAAVAGRAGFANRGSAGSGRSPRAASDVRGGHVLARRGCVMRAACRGRHRDVLDEHSERRDRFAGRTAVRECER
jgi:hypothetical protein